MSIQPETGDARTSIERRFEFCCFGNFAGHDEERPELPLHPINPNRWDDFFKTIQPQCNIWLHFEGVDDFKVSFSPRHMRDFRPKGLTQNIPLLHAIDQLNRQVGEASETNPVAVSDLGGETMAWLIALANQTGDEGFVDLLSMVDLGEGQDDGLYLKYLKAFFKDATYSGKDRSRVQGDLATVAQHVLDQITKDSGFRQLESSWSGLHALMGQVGDQVKLQAIDCSQAEICDAFFLNFVKPETGSPAKVDLALTSFELDHHGPSLHTLHHLGRMAAHLNVPVIFNAAPELLGAKGYAHLSQIQDISGKFRDPAHTKWRKLRDEEGAEWLFAALNPWRVNERDDQRPVWAAPAFFVAGLLSRQLRQDKWPSELLGATGTWDISEQTAAKLSDQQAIDYAYEGIGVLGTKPQGTALMGMNMLADVKLSGPESLEAANFVDYTIAYRFFAGCASRYFLETYLGDRDNERLADYLQLESAGELTVEEDEGQLICRFKAPFTIYGTHADMVVGAVLEPQT